MNAKEIRSISTGWGSAAEQVQLMFLREIAAQFAESNAYNYAHLTEAGFLRDEVVRLRQDLKDNFAIPQSRPLTQEDRDWASAKIAQIEAHDVDKV